MKSGWITTEFWVTLSPIVVAIGELMKDPPKTSADAVMRFAVIMALALSSFGYSNSRAKVKTSAMETRADMRSR